MASSTPPVPASDSVFRDEARESSGRESSVHERSVHERNVHERNVHERSVPTRDEKVHERVHLLSRVMDAAEGRRIVLIVDEVGFDHRLVIESVGEAKTGSAEQCEANR